MGRGTTIQKSLKLINVGNKSYDAQKVNNRFLKTSELEQIVSLENRLQELYAERRARFYVKHIIDCLLSNQG